MKQAEPEVPDPDDREKPRAARVAVELTAHCQIGHAFHRLPVADLSRSGLKLHTRELTPTGTPVRVALALPGAGELRFCTFSGQVARVAVDAAGRTLGLGVSFVEAERDELDREALVGFLEGLGG